jgi:hypothetical protein
MATAPTMSESHCQVIPFRVPILRDFRTVLYAGSCTEWIPYTSGLYGQDLPHFGAGLCLLAAGVSQRRVVLHDDAYIRTFAFAVHSHLLDV